jgi:hypothetical protein
LFIYPDKIIEWIYRWSGRQCLALSVSIVQRSILRLFECSTLSSPQSSQWFESVSRRFSLVIPDCYASKNLTLPSANFLISTTSAVLRLLLLLPFVSEEAGARSVSVDGSVILSKGGIPSCYALVSDAVIVFVDPHMSVPPDQITSRAGSRR